MVTRKSLYDPAWADDFQKAREEAFSSVDQMLFLHVGHYVGWYGSVEIMFTVLLQYVCGFPNAEVFHVLTRGMDARVKLERFLEICAIQGYAIGPGLSARLDHFQNVHIPLRNKLVHNHLYWPDGDTLQVTSVGEPPLFKDVHIPAPEPFQIDGLDLFERGIWLGQFSSDLGDIHMQMTQPPGTLEKDAYYSSLPRGHQPRALGSTRNAKKRKPLRKPPTANPAK